MDKTQGAAPTASPPQYQLQKFIQFREITKLDEQKRQVWGIATAEVQDRAGEICDYAAAKKAFQEWSEEARESTTKAGQEVSLGNLRYQHTLQPVGKVISIEYRDDAKEVYIGAYISDDQTWEECKKGILRGFSQGGSYDWRQCNVCKTSMCPPDEENPNLCPKCKKVVVTRFGPDIAEMSVVDNPCVKPAVFDALKGQQVGTTKVLLEVIDLKKLTAKQARDKIGEITKALETCTDPAEMKKGMYQIGQLASILQSLAYLSSDSRSEGAWEDDPRDLAIADELDDFIEHGVEILKQIVEDETSELTAQNKAQAEGELTKMNPNELSKAGASLAGHFKDCAKLHKSLQDHHEKIAAAHAAASDGEEVNPDVAKAFKASASRHEKIAKCHEGHAEKCTKMAESMSETSKAAEGLELQKVAPAATIVPPAAAVAIPPAAAAEAAVVDPSAEAKGEIQKAFQGLMKEAIADLIKSPETQNMFKQAAAVQLKEQLAGTLAPLPGKADLSKAAGSPAGTTHEVPRFAQGITMTKGLQLEETSETGL